MGREFVLRKLRTQDDVEQDLELMRKVFGEKSRVDLQVKKWLSHHPLMTLRDFIVIKHQGKIVASLCLIPLEWKIGEVSLKVAELGCVATVHEYRNRGLQRRLMAEYHKHVQTERYDLSVVEGIPYFYRQFGYEYAIPLDERTTIRLSKIPDYKSTCMIRPLAPQNVPTAADLLAQTQHKFYVHSVRSEGVWKMQQKTRMVAEYEFQSYSVKQEGQMMAYFRTSQNPETRELLLREVTDVSQSEARSIMRFLKELGLHRGLETLACTVSHHEPFVKHLVATGGTEQRRPYAWQIRVTDCLMIIRKMKTLFEKRLESSIYSRLTEKVTFNFYQYAIQLTIEKGAVIDVQRLDSSEDRTARFNPTVFTQLLLGYRSRKELELIYPDFAVRPSHRGLIDVLFPRLTSYIHTAY